MHCGRMHSLWEPDRAYADHFLEVDFLIILVPHKWFYQFHRIPRVERDPQRSSSPDPAQHITQGPTLCPRVLSKHFFRSLRLGAVTTSQRSLSQCPTALCVKNLCLISHLNLCWQNCRPFLWVLSLTLQRRDQCLPPASPPEEAVTAMTSPLSLL